MTLRKTGYKVVINHEEQYSIIPVDQRVSSGWREVGKTGSQSECIKFIEEVWTDMTTRDRDLILRRLNR
ncbi:MAG: MbtH family NRPS accessory protein [Gammaproteobacteria bacterium]|nr:MbtH family NRPS accessory protein [Gammaproteobacteria bacterium]